MNNVLSAVRNWTHHLLPFIGLLSFAGTSIAQVVGSFGVPQHVTLTVLGSIGAIAAGWSKFVDSRSFTDIQTAATAVQSGNALGVVDALAQAGQDAQAQQAPAPPPAAAVAG